MTAVQDFSLAELMIVTAAEAWRGDGELLAHGIGTLPRLAVALAKLTFEDGLLLTDGEAFAIEDPIPLGPRHGRPALAGWMPFSRVFDALWSGRRHAMVTPVQVDRWGQANISALGPDFARPKVQMLGVRGFPGNSISHKNSFLFTGHSKRAFVEGEVDVVSSVGFSDKRWPDGMARPEIQIGLVVTDLCVMDFGGPDHAARVRSVHPGVGFEDVQAATGFPLLEAEGMGTTPAPTAAQLEIIARLDPTNLRAHALRGNPPGIRPAAAA